MLAMNEVPPNLVGRIKTFGDFGPKYEITQDSRAVDHELMVKIILVESGEAVEYSLEHIVEDPDAI